jgi:hypothetical protein
LINEKERVSVSIATEEQWTKTKIERRQSDSAAGNQRQWCAPSRRVRAIWPSLIVHVVAEFDPDVKTCKSTAIGRAGE